MAHLITSPVNPDIVELVVTAQLETPLLLVLKEIEKSPVNQT